METGNKYIPSEDPSPEQDKGRLTGEPAGAGAGTIPAEQTATETAATPPPRPQAAPETAGILTGQANLKKVTSEGGLTRVPYDFEQKDGSWKFILSDNPFEVLYIDYLQKEMVAPPLIEKNFVVLGAFWHEKLMLMNGAAREKIKARYGEETVNNAEPKLADAYNKIKTTEGIENYARELDHKRIADGISALADFIEFALIKGELTPKEANILIAKGIEQHLSEAEVRRHLLKILEEQGFEKRTIPLQEDELKNVWRQQWIKDPQQNSVGWLGTQVASLEEMGKVSFNNREQAYDRFKNAVYLPAAVMTITRDDAQVKIFENIIEQYTNEEIRYLKIIYRLNPSLPFRFGNGMYNNIKDLLNDAVQDADGFWKADEMFRNGYLQTWIEESDAVEALKLKDLQRNTPGFLSFIYQVNDQYPFYLDQLRINQPENLAIALQQHADLWNLATRYITSRYVATWLAGIGRNDLNDTYNQLLQPVLQAEWYTDQERNMGAVQTLIQTLNKQTPVPAIRFNKNTIQLLAVEGTGNATQQFSLALQNQGYTAATLQLKNAPPGIRLSVQKLILFSLTQQSAADIVLDIDVFSLAKNNLYQFSIIARTPYQAIELPIQLKVVFPTPNFIQKLVMYGLGSGIFWGLAQIIIIALLGKPYSNAVSRGIVFMLFSLAFLVVYYRIITAYLNRELRSIKTNSVSSSLIKTILFLAYIGSPVIRDSVGMWFFFWLFPGALLGSYIACRKYNLNKWLPVIPLIITILMAIVLKGKDIADILGRL